MKFALLLAIVASVMVAADAASIPSREEITEVASGWWDSAGEWWNGWTTSFGAAKDTVYEMGEIVGNKFNKATAAVSKMYNKHLEAQD